MMIIGLLIQIATIGLIVYAVVAAVRRRRGEPIGRSEFSVRRLFTYLMLFGSLMVVAFGLSGLLGAALSGAAARTAADLAAPLALAMTGIPVFAFLATRTWRTVGGDAAERASIGWALYLNGALLAALGGIIGSAFAVAAAAVDGEWEGFALAGLAVWTVVWIGHWLAWARFQPTVIPRLHLWIGSVAGLWIGGVSTGLAIDQLVGRLIRPEPAVGAPGWDDLWLALCGVAIGGAVWSWHWLANGRNGPRSKGWYAYVLLAGVAGGLIAAVAGAGFGLYLVLVWLIGDPGTTTAGVHFADVSGALGAVAVGLGAWRYHRAVVGPGSSRDRTEVDRIYDYLVSGIALVTMAVATSILVVAIFEALTPIAAGASASNTLLAALTLLVVGGPMWMLTWRRVQRLAAAHTTERSSPTRRVYLYGVSGVGGIVAFGATISVLVSVFEALFEGWSAAALAAAVDVPVALLVTAGGAALYHWMVYRAEGHDVAPVPRRDILLVADGIDADEVARRAQVHIHLLHRTDLPKGSAIDVDAVVDAIDHAEGEHLMVLAGPGGVRVIPYE